MRELTDIQLKMLKHLYRRKQAGIIYVPIAGYGNAPYLSACRALVRKGLATTYKTGFFDITEAGENLLLELANQD